MAPLTGCWALFLNRSWHSCCASRAIQKRLSLSSGTQVGYNASVSAGHQFIEPGYLNNLHVVYSIPALISLLPEIDRGMKIFRRITDERMAGLDRQNAVNGGTGSSPETPFI